MITEIWLGVPVTAGGKEQIQRLDEGYELQPHGRGASHQRYVMAHRRCRPKWTQNEMDALRRLWTAGATRAAIRAAIPARTWKAIKMQAGRYGWHRGRLILDTTAAPS